MLRVHRAGERYAGGDGDAGIHTRHAFSFSGHYDPANTGFGLLVACNEELLAPGAGFAEHPHRDLDIVTWVVEGELTHRDSTGRTSTVLPGDVQRLSAGSGVRHVERNDADAPLRFLQMWLVPGVFGVPPEYEIVRGISDGTPYALPRSESVLHTRRLVDGERSALPAAPWLYLHVVRGQLDVLPAEVALAGAAGAEPVRLADGDAARVTGGEELFAVARGGAECLIWEMHTEPTYG
ncbi:pirin family protein [Streptomyces sp. P38-E01]|uniref:Pirin family protein n=1 Tax=Streptomyces tardus TaxID=2780544 RepID=A0A949JSC7_9ACTN|nr:pirin family protein [Streptomyces tardus]MBU7599275.1 pirin family protein [Streptomyces tardus]